MSLAIVRTQEPDGTYHYDCGHDIAIRVALNQQNGHRTYPVEVLHQGASLLSTDTNLRDLRALETLRLHADTLHKLPEWHAILTEVARLLKEESQAQPRVRAVRISARELLAKDIEPLTYVVADILPAGCTVLTGKSKDGKSLAAYDIAVAVASNGTALGRYGVTPGSVWYMALEDGERRAQHRLKMMHARAGTQLSGEAQDRLAFTLWKAPRLGEGLEEEIVDWITTTPDARLLIIDILEKIRPPRRPHGNNYAQDYEPTARLAELAQERNVAILIIHHANKLNPDDFRDSASGCMSLIGGADNFWSLSRMPMAEDATLNVIGRDILPQELSLEFKDGYWTVLGEKRLVMMSKERQAIVEVLRASKKPLTPKDIAQAVKKKPATTTMTLRKMLDTGVLMQPTEGHYALSPSYLSTTVDSIDRVDSADSVDSVDSPGDQGGESTGVNAESTVVEKAQVIEKQKQSGATVNGSTGSMGSTHFDALVGTSDPKQACTHPETRAERIPEDGSSLVRCTTCHRVVRVIPPKRNL